MHPLIDRVWCTDSTTAPGLERVLPTGAMHVVFRLSDEPLLLIEDGRRRTVARAVVGGARSSFYTRVIGGRTRSVGAMLKPGAARALFGVSAGELAERHTLLADLWGSTATALLHDELLAAKNPLDVFVRALGRRLASSHRWEGAELPIELSIAELAHRSGYSHRVFTTKFRDEVGLAPKAFAKVQRLQRAIALLQTNRSLAEVAYEAGYADQPHLCRDFAVLAGISPSAYRRLSPASANHVDFVQDARR